MQTKNIVIFGMTGAGKSSVVNLMAGQEIAGTSPDMQRCTLQWQEHQIAFDGCVHKVFDTVGLEEPQLGMKEYLDIIVNAHNLITKLNDEGGIDLLLFCVRAGRFTATIQNNYRLFYEWLCEKKVPIILVLTGLEREKNMEDWWTNYKATFDKYKIIVNGHACITAAKGLDGRHKELYEDSRRLVCKLVTYHTRGKGDTWNGNEGWRRGEGLFMRFMDKLRELLSGSIPKKKNIVTVLTKRCGMPREAAIELASQIRQESGRKSST
jgi:hypothetical protein